MFYFDSKLHIFEPLTNAAGGYWYTAVQETSKSFVVLFYTPEKKTIWLLHYVSGKDFPCSVGGSNVYHSVFKEGNHFPVLVCDDSISEFCSSAHLASSPN